jgi:hypothetical protein
VIVPKEITANPPHGERVYVANARYGYKPRVTAWVSCARDGCPEQAVARVEATTLQGMEGVRPGALLLALRVCEADVDWARSKFQQQSIVIEGKV